METKVCSSCTLEKPISQFNKKSSSKDNLSVYCKECNKQKLKEHYYSNKELYYNKQKRRREKLQKCFVEYKKTLKCIKCEEDRWWVLDFHHRDSSTKEGYISNLLHKSKKAFEDELEKCDVLCANCHRDTHYQENL